MPTGVATGDMTCRAPTSSLTCSGTPTGQAMQYDALRRHLSWQNTTTGPTSTAQYASNGSSERVQQSMTSGGTTTTTVYVGSYEEVSTTGGTTKYYTTPLVTGKRVNGTLSYLANDDLGSVSVALSTSGSVTATELYAPYRTVRYSNGAMPTSYGFTGQRLDGSGLDYMNARYYDPAVGQFTSADTVEGPNRYQYVGGNPETRTDPTGHCPWCFVGAAIGGVAGAVVAIHDHKDLGTIIGTAALGAAAGFAIGANPVSGGLAAGASLIGSLVTHQGDATQAFQSAAISGIAGSLGSGATTAIGKMYASPLTKLGVNFFAQGGIAATASIANDWMLGRDVNPQEAALQFLLAGGVSVFSAIAYFGRTGLKTSIGPGGIRLTNWNSGRPVFSWGEKAKDLFDGVDQGVAALARTLFAPPMQHSRPQQNPSSSTTWRLGMRAE